MVFKPILTTVSLVGLTEPQVLVNLFEDGDLSAEVATTETDATGSYRFENLALDLGANAFAVTGTDLAGNTNQTDLEVTRLPVDADAPVVTLSLTNDTGRSDRPETFSDTRTSDPTITGLIADDHMVVEVLGSNHRRAAGDRSSDARSTPCEYRLQRHSW